MISATLINPVQTSISGFPVTETIWKFIAKSLDEYGTHVSNPMRPGMKPCLYNMRVYVVAFKPMIDSHQIANISVFLLRCYSGFPALPGWESRPSILDCTQELPAICFAFLQQLSGTRGEFYPAARGKAHFAKGEIICRT
jgi:hypothetical protein